MDDPLLNIYSFKFNELYIYWHEIENLNLRMDDPLLHIYSFKFNKKFRFLQEIKNLNLRWMIHCWTSIVSNLMKFIYIGMK